MALGKDGHYLSSDALALAGKAQTMIYLEEGDLVALDERDYAIWDCNGKKVDREVKTMPMQAEAVELGSLSAFHAKGDF